MAYNSLFKRISTSTSLVSSIKSDSLRRASSLYSHQVSRNFAKVAVDAVHLAGAIRKGLTMDDTVEGDYYTTIGSLGEKDYKKLCADSGLGLVTINYCQSGLEHQEPNLDKDKLKEDSGESNLSDIDVQEINQMKCRGVINHDYLLLELQRGGPSGETFYLLAEKLCKGGPQGKPGIFISFEPVAHVEGFLLNNDTKLYVIECRKKLIPLLTLLETLKEVNPDYSLRNANCWDYATTTAKKLAMKCAVVDGISAEEKARLKGEHKNLEAKLNDNNIFNFTKKVVAWGLSSTNTSAIS